MTSYAFMVSFHYWYREEGNKFITLTMIKMHVYSLPSRCMAHLLKCVRFYVICIWILRCVYWTKTFGNINNLHLQQLIWNWYILCTIEVTLKLYNAIIIKIILFADAHYLIMQNIRFQHKAWFGRVIRSIWPKVNALYAGKMIIQH